MCVFVCGCVNVWVWVFVRVFGGGRSDVSFSSLMNTAVEFIVLQDILNVVRSDQRDHRINVCQSNWSEMQQATVGKTLLHVTWVSCMCSLDIATNSSKWINSNSNKNYFKLPIIVLLTKSYACGQSYPWESTHESRALNSNSSCTIWECPSAQARCSAVLSKLSFASISILKGWWYMGFVCFALFLLPLRGLGG